MQVCSYEYSGYIALDEQEKEALILGEKLSGLLSESQYYIYRSWQKIICQKIQSYGSVAWSHNGFRGLFNSMSAKHFRLIHSTFDWDSLRDIFGYTVLGLILAKKYGVDVFGKINARHNIRNSQVLFEQLKLNTMIHDMCDVDLVIQMMIDYMLSIFEKFAGELCRRTGVIIPTYQRPQQVLDTIHSIGDFLDIYVVYNCGRENDVESLKQFSNVKLIATSGSGAGVSACGADVAISDQKEFLIFSNDDVVFQKHSGLTLLEPFFSDENIGVVGVLNGWKDYYDLKQMPIWFERPYTGVAWATLSKVYSEIGGLDDKQKLGEDLDYQIKLKISGRKILINQEADAIHHWDSPGGLSDSEMWRGSSRRYVGRPWICRKINEKIPGILFLDEEMNWGFNEHVIQLYHKLYQSKRIELTKDGIVWKKLEEV